MPDRKSPVLAVVSMAASLNHFEILAVTLCTNVHRHIRAKGDRQWLLRHDTFSGPSIEAANTHSAGCEAMRSVVLDGWAMEWQWQKMRVRRWTALRTPKTPYGNGGVAAHAIGHNKGDYRKATHERPDPLGTGLRAAQNCAVSKIVENRLFPNRLTLRARPNSALIPSFVDHEERQTKFDLPRLYPPICGCFGFVGQLEAGSGCQIWSARRDLGA